MHTLFGKLIKQLKREKAEAEENLKHVTWLKCTVVKYIINNYLKRDEEKENTKPSTRKTTD